MDIIWDVTHTRQILYVKARGQIEDVDREPGACLPDYWLIVDTIEASEPHSYQLLFHTAPGLSASAAGGRMQALGGDTIPGTGIVLGTARRAQLYLIPANPLEVRVSQLTGSTDPIQGWYSEEFGEKAPVTTVIFERTTAPHETPQPAAPKTTVLATLVYPRRIGEQERSATEPAAARAIPTIKPLSLPVDNRLAFVVSYTEGDKGAGTDYLMLPVGRASQHAKQAETPQAVQLGPCQCSSASSPAFARMGRAKSSPALRGKTANDRARCGTGRDNAGRLSVYLLRAWVRFMTVLSAFWAQLSGKDLADGGKLATFFVDLAGRPLPPFKGKWRLLCALGDRPYVSPRAQIGCANLHLSPKCFIDDYVTIYAHPQARGGVYLARDVRIYRWCMIELGDGDTSLHVGEHTSIQSGCIMNSFVGSITIGANCMIAPRCSFMPYQHGYADRDRPDVAAAHRQPGRHCP